MELKDNVLTGEVYHVGEGAYLSSTGPATFAGLKAILRDLVSQVELSDSDISSVSDGSGDIYVN